MNHLNPAQAEQLKEIGIHLRQRRQAMSIPIEEIAAKTLIRLTLLKALEDGQSDQLPEPVFIQGFIRRYGDAVGLDGIALAKTFPTSIWPVESDTSIQDLPKPRDRAIPLYVPGILLVVAAASGLFYLLNKPRTAEPVVQMQSPTVAEAVPSVSATPTTSGQQNSSTVVEAVPSVSATPTASGLNTPIQVTVDLKDLSWLRVVADGKTQFEGLLTKGTQKTWTAKKQLSLRAGNAGAVSLSFNQREPKVLGALGDVEDVTFTNSTQRGATLQGTPSFVAPR